MMEKSMKMNVLSSKTDNMPWVSCSWPARERRIRHAIRCKKEDKDGDVRSGRMDGRWGAEDDFGGRIQMRDGELGSVLVMSVDVVPRCKPFESFGGIVL